MYVLLVCIIIVGWYLRCTIWLLYILNDLSEILQTPQLKKINEYLGLTFGSFCAKRRTARCGYINPEATAVNQIYRTYIFFFSIILCFLHDVIFLDFRGYILDYGNRFASVQLQTSNCITSNFERVITYY